MIIVGDVHGCFKTFIALIEKLPKDEMIYLVGDFIDRGPNSKDMIEFLIKNSDRFRSVKGNHERMVELAQKDYWWRQNWINSNGGDRTLSSYENKTILKEHIDFIKNLPLLIKVDNILITHSSINPIFGLENFYKYQDRDDGVLWNRGSEKELSKDVFHVFGHTPNRKIKEYRNKERCYAINIDTGCVFSPRINKTWEGYGRLTAIKLSGMIIFEQENIENL